MSALVYMAPRLLMISGHVPQERGAGERARAWRLLLDGAEVCETWLVAAKDGPVNLADWRALDTTTHRLSLVTGSFTARRNSVLAATVARWNYETEFDAVLCTDPRLWNLAQRVNAKCRICDTAFATIGRKGHALHAVNADLVLSAGDDPATLTQTLQDLRRTNAASLPFQGTLRIAA